MEWFKHIVKVNQKTKKGRLNYGEIIDINFSNTKLKLAWNSYIEKIYEQSSLDTINNQTIENNNRYSEKIIYQIINLKEFQNYLKVFKNVLHEGNVLESENNFKNLYKYEIDNIDRDNEDIFYYVNDYFDSGFEDIFLREKGSRIIEPTPVIEIKINNETNCFTETANNLVINDSKVNDEIFCLYKDFPEIAIYDVVKKLELLSTVKHVKINRNIINLLSHILIL